MNSILLPAMTGSRALGTSTQKAGSWLTCISTAPMSYQGSIVETSHRQPAVAVVPAAEAGNAGVGADAARKRGRPPRGNHR